MDLILCFCVFLAALHSRNQNIFLSIKSLYNPPPNILIISTSEDGGSAFLQNAGKSLPLLQGSKTGKKKSKQVESFDERKLYS